MISILFLLNFFLFFVHAISPSTFEWTQFIGSNFLDTHTPTESLFLDSFEHLWLTGGTNQTLFGPHEDGGMDFWMASYDSYGQFLCGDQIPVIGQPIGQAVGSDIIMDTLGYMYFTGFLLQSHFENQTKVGNDYFVIKYTAHCELIWIRQFGATIGMLNVASAIDLRDNTLILTRADSGSSYFVAKHNSSTGDLLWKHTSTLESKAGIVYCTATIVDKQGNIYVTGTTIHKYFLSKWNSEGQLLWSHEVGGIKAQGNALTLEAEGNIFVTGITSESLSGQPKIGLNDAFLAYYDPNGNLLWSRQFGEPNGDVSGWGLTLNFFRDTVFLIGRTDQSLISNQSLIGLLDFFVAEYDTQGNILSLEQYGWEDRYSYPAGIVLDTDGHRYYGGNIRRDKPDTGPSQGFLVQD